MNTFDEMNEVNFFSSEFDDLVSEFPQETIEYASQIGEGGEDIFEYVRASMETIQ